MSTRDVFLGTGHLLESSYVQLQQWHINQSPHWFNRFGISDV